jgi:hypothetical protein
MKTRLKFPIAVFIAMTLAAADGPSAPAVPVPSVPRLECATPRALRLHRFEDGSAQLFCGRRILARISSPG